MQQSLQNKKNPRISAIAAIGKKTRALGKGNKLLWHIKEDWERVKRLTMGHPIIMGRKTFESIGKPLPERTNIVITRNSSFSAPGCIIVHSLEEALEKARAAEKEEIFIFGGGDIYKQALPYTDRLYLTLVDSDATGDTFFPDYHEFTKEISREEKRGDQPFTFVTLER